MALCYCQEGLLGIGTFQCIVIHTLMMIPLTSYTASRKWRLEGVVRNRWKTNLGGNWQVHKYICNVCITYAVNAPQQTIDFIDFYTAL